MHSPVKSICLFGPCLLLAILPLSAPGEVTITDLRFHPESVITVNTNSPSMNKSWPGHNYSEDIGMPKSGTYVFVEPKLWGDRCEYRADDVTAQFYGLLPLPKEGAADLKVRAELCMADLRKLLAEQVAPATDSHISFLVDIAALPAGKYAARVSLVAADGQTKAQAQWPFEKTARQTPVVRVPAEGIPIRLETQPFLADGLWPMRVGVPIPINAVTNTANLALFEDDKPVPFQVIPVATWCPRGSVKWAHLSFTGRYKAGKPCEYRLKLMPQPGTPPVSPLKVTQTDALIEVDTGAVKFQISRKAFAGIEKAWYDPSGKGKYNDAAPELLRKDLGGPYLVDEKGARFEAARDSEASVMIEEQGTARVVIAASGWYTNTEAPEKRLCKFTTRISAFAGHPMVRVDQHTYITYDTRFKQLNDLAFHLPLAGAKTFDLGSDEATISGALPAAPRTVYLHQEKFDHYQLVGAADKEGKQSDGWFSVSRAPGAARVTALLRDIWQKYPKELEFGADGLTVHFWPAHGREAFTREEELSIRNIYKFFCFHQGKLLNLLTPSTYLERFDQYAKDTKLNEGGPWWRESEHDATKSANGQGLVIANEFALVFTPAEGGEAPLGRDLANLGRMFRFDPSALTSPEWNAASGALGKMAPPDRMHFGEFEEALEKGYLSWNRSVERNNDYGMFNYADTHTIWNVEENRPGLHRVWQASHYHQLGLNWLLWYRSGSSDLLRWARKSTDHHMNIDMCNYVDEKNPIPFMDHELGAMQHMGWKQHWASSASGEAWGQFRASTGHFIDPDGELWCWYLTGNRRAKEAYGFWVDAYRGQMAGHLFGYAREVNTTLAYAITAYQATWNPTIIPAIYSPARCIRTYMPLEKQRPGPLWHPLWVNRYYEQTRDPEYIPFITKYADMWTNDESTWTLALCGEAYELTGDKKFLEKHLPLVRDWPRGFHREEGSPYDWFGRGEGPLGGNYGYLSWGYFLKILQEAKLTTLPTSMPPRGNYPGAPERFNHFNLPDSVTVLALKEKDIPFTVKLGFVGDACSVLLKSPAGKEQLKIDRTDLKGQDQPVTIPADGETGLYRLEFRAHRAWPTIPQTDLPVEAALIRSGRPYFGFNTLAWLMPLEQSPVTLKFTSEKQGFHSIQNVRVEDAKGQVLLQKGLFHELKRMETSVTLDPARNPAPWKLDIMGTVQITFAEPERGFLMGANVESMKRIAQELAK